MDIPLPLLAASYMGASQMSNVTIVLMYAALLVIVTSMISLRTNDPDPMLAGRNMPWWLIGASLVGTTISSIAFLAYPGKGYAFDLNLLIGDFFAKLIGPLICLFCFVTFLRKTRDASIYTLLQDRFGRWSAIFASVAFITHSTVRMGVITCLVAEAVHLICGADIVSVIILTGIMVIFYTYMSGIEGVIWTDLFQTILLLIAGIASIYFLLEGIPHKGSDLWEAIRSSSAVQQKNAELTNNWDTLAIACLFFAATSTEYFAANQGIAQRYIVARSDRHAKWGLAMGGIIVPWIIVLFFGIGILLYVFHQTHPQMIEIPAGGTGNVFAHFIAHHFPDGLKGLAVVGILAAAMSTIDTGINSSSTVLICNLYEPFARASTHRQSLLTMQILRASSAAFGAAGIFMAYLVYLNGSGALDFFWKSLGIIGSGVFGLFILMRISKKAGPKAGMCGLVVGFLVALWMTLTAGKDYVWANPFHYMLTFPISVAVTVAIGLLMRWVVSQDAATLNEHPNVPSAKMRKQLAAQRRRTKKNIFSDSIRPKPFYRLYAGIAMIGGLIIYIEGPHIGLIPLDYWFVWMAVVLLGLVVLLPWIIDNTNNKTYTFICVALLGLSLPFLGAIALFSHPNESAFGYFYLATVIALGTLVGWTMLGLATMIATAVSSTAGSCDLPYCGDSG